MRDAKTMSALAVLLVGVSFADPPVQQAKPTLGEYPAITKPAPPPVPRSPDGPRELPVDRFRLFWVNDYTGTIPVRWTVTPINVYALADSIPVPKGSPVVGILAGELRAKAHYPPEGSSNVIALWGMSEGLILLQADGVKDGQIVTLVKVLIDVKIGQGAQPPPVVDPPGTPPTKPVKGHFMAIRPNGPASAEYVRIMGDSAWDELRAAGHSVKDYTLAEAAEVAKVPSGTTLPCVITLDSSNRSVLAGPVNLPTDSAGIRKLAEGVK